MTEELAKRSMARAHGHNDLELASRCLTRMKGQFSQQDVAELNAWRYARSYADILDLNRAYLRGQVEICPYFFGPVYGETLPALPTLLRLHDYGMLSIDSQPARTIAPNWDQCHCCDEWWWFQSRQRAYLTFMIPKNKDLINPAELLRFIVHLTTDSRIYASVEDGKSGCTGLPQKWSTHKKKKARTAEAIDHAEAHYEQRLVLDAKLASELAGRHLFLFNETGALETAELFTVNVLARGWGEMDLPAVVEQAAIASGLKPAFQ
ncbi:methylenetetrahydrofolate reductase (NAD(P)H) met13 [Elasticomyces elasticus]|nr:methylenetetrahydrofolate reductase (NAD(P)H) met13 [Elasticomyces elasticus]